MSYIALGTDLKRIRNQAGLEQQDLARCLDIPLWTYIGLENGRGIFYEEWLDKLPGVMRAPMVQALQRQLRQTIEYSQSLIDELDRFFQPAPSAEKEPPAPPVIRRPTAISPNL